MLPLWADLSRRRSAVVTGLLIAVNLGVFGYQWSLAASGGERAVTAFVREFALVPARFTAGFRDERQWLTILTSMFLHGGTAHVLGNCWFLWVFGKNVEDRLGSFRYLLFYLISGVGAAALQVLVAPDSRIPMLGASGAISGVLGGYFVLFPGAWIYTLVPWVVPILPLPAFLFLIVWFAIQTLSGVGSFMSGEMAHGGVAWFAHVGGFLAGLGMTLLAGGRRKESGVRGVRS